jgi:deoxycytidylate deaminase
MTEKYERPSWDDYLMEVAHAVSKRASSSPTKTAR